MAYLSRFTTMLFVESLVQDTFNKLTEIHIPKSSSSRGLLLNKFI